VVITREPLSYYMPLELAAKGIVITQYDMNAVERMGLVKMDLLGQRALAVVDDTAKAVRRNYSKPLELGTIAPDDPVTRGLLANGRTIGCFQIESPGMRSLLKMMRAVDRSDVMIGLSLIRPGPASSGMKERYIRRRLGLERPEYLHPALEAVLGETYGVMLYQEDILKVAEAVAGFTLSEGDALRKAISKKRSPERMAAIRDGFVRRAVERGAAPEAAEGLWRNIANFAGYSYCKAHAATYSHISYQAAYLKAHYPAEYLASVFNNQAGFYPPAEYLEEARRFGVEILAADVNRSGVHFRAKDGRMRIGLMQVKGLGRRTLEMILRERTRGAFVGVEDFLARARPARAEAEALAGAGALDGMTRSRPEALWRVRLFYKKNPGGCREGRAPAGGELFAGARARAEERLGGLRDYESGAKVALEERFLDMSATEHPLAAYRPELEGRDLVTTRDLGSHTTRLVRMAGWLVTTRRVPTSRGEFMLFAMMEDEFGTVETTLFPEVYRKYGHLFTTHGPYLIAGVVEDSHGSITLNARDVAVLESSA
jgi:DNA polymerase III alpha subunit